MSRRSRAVLVVAAASILVAALLALWNGMGDLTVAGPRGDSPKVHLVAPPAAIETPTPAPTESTRLQLPTQARLEPVVSPDSAGATVANVSISIVESYSRQPLPGTVLTLVLTDDRTYQRREIADSKGNVALTSIPVGEYAVQVGFRGRGSIACGTLTVAEGRTDYEVEAFPYEPLTVRVLNVDGEPVKDFELRTQLRWDGFSSKFLHYRTDAEGRLSADTYHPEIPLFLSVEHDSLLGLTTDTIRFDDFGITRQFIRNGELVLYTKTIQPLTLCFGLLNVPPKYATQSLMVMVEGEALQVVQMTGEALTGCAIIPHRGEIPYTVNARDAENTMHQLARGLLTLEPDETSREVVVDLAENKTLKVKLLGPKGPVKDAILHLETQDSRNARVQNVESNRSKSDGLITIPVQPYDKLQLTLESPTEYVFAEVPEIAYAAIGREAIDLKLVRATQIHGTIVNGDGRPVPEAYVWVIDAKGQRAGTPVQSDRKGAFRFHGADALRREPHLVLGMTEDGVVGAILLQTASREEPLRLTAVPRQLTRYPGVKPADLELEFLSDLFQYVVPESDDLLFGAGRFHDEEGQFTVMGLIPSEHFKVRIIAPKGAGQ